MACGSLLGTEETLANLSRGFACPQEQWSSCLADTITLEHARHVVRLFITQHRNVLKANSEGLTELIEAWVPPAFPSGTSLPYWNAAFSNAYESVGRRHVSDILAAGALLGVHLNALGENGAWSVRLPEPRSVRWSHFLIPKALELCVLSDGSTANLCTWDGASRRRLSFERGPAPAQWRARAAIELPVLRGKRAGITMLPGSVYPKEAPFPDTFRQVMSLRRWSASWQGALDLLMMNAPPYYSWAERIIDSIVSLKRAPRSRVIRSGSISSLVGVIWGSVHSEARALAETLVHEASHQYFYLATQLGPVDDASDTNLYYSPAVQTARPLSRILLAFHAFANVLLYYRACRRTGAQEDSYFDRHETRLERDVKQLSIPLLGNPALTSVGRSLCDPLIERVV